MIRAVFFDFDNTLFDRTRFFYQYLNDFADRNMNVSEKYPRDFVLKKMIKKDEYGYCERSEYYQWMAETFECPGMTAEDIRKDFSDHFPNLIRPSAEVSDLLAQLKSRYSLYIVTNGSYNLQQRKISRFQIDHFFSEIFISGQIGVSKPDPCIFEYALEKSGFKTGDALFVGDDPWRDIHGAGSFGMKTCWISMGRAFPEEFHKPDFSISRIHEIRNILL